MGLYNCTSSDSKRKRSIRVTKTAVLVYSWICLGLFSEILGPTLPTLMHQTKANYEQIGFALSIRSVGLLSGSLIGGLVSDKWSHARHLQMGFALILAALTNFLLPWITVLPTMVFVLYLAGFSHGFLTTGGNPLLGSIWIDKATGPFNLMHAGYGIGAAIAPLMVAPFAILVANSTNTTEKVYLPRVSNSTEESALVDPTVPYNIIGGILLTCAVCFLPFNRRLLFCRRRRNRESQYKINKQTSVDSTKEQTIVETIRSKLIQTIHMLSPSSIFKNRLMILCIGCVFIAYFAVVGNERVFGKFMFPYAIFGPIEMPTSNAYILHLVYWICFASARIVVSFISIWIPARLLLIIITLGTVLSSVGLILIPKTTFWFFLFTCLFSMFKSPLFCVILGAISRSKEITGFIVLFVNLGSAAGASLMQYTTGSLIQLYGQTVFPYIVSATAFVVLLASFLLLFILKKMGDRFLLEEIVSPTSDV